MPLDIWLSEHNWYPVISEWLDIWDVIAQINTEVLWDVEDVLDIFAIKWNKTWESIDETQERIFRRNKDKFQEMFPEFFTEERTAQDFNDFLDETDWAFEKVYEILWHPVNEFSNQYLWTETNKLPEFDTIWDLLDTVKYFPTRLQWNPRLPERYKKIHSWKVRETYEHPDNPDELIMIATDRISTHDVIHMGTILGKWKALTKMSNYWFNDFATNESTKDIPNQLVDNPTFPEECSSDWGNS